MMLKTVRVVNVSSILGKINRMSNIKHLSLCMLQLFKHQSCFATASTADNNQRWLLAVYGFLGIVK